MLHDSPVATSTPLELRTAARALAVRSSSLDAELVAVLALIDERRLFLGWAYPSLFAFCVEELGLSEDAAYARIVVARAAGRLPAVLEALRSHRVHLAGLRLLVPHLTPENCAATLLAAERKSKREIEELVARLAPRPPVSDSVRRIPAAAPPLEGGAAEASAGAVALTAAGPGAAPCAPTRTSSAAALAVGAAAESGAATGAAAQSPGRISEVPRQTVEPLSEDSYRIQFTGTRALRDKVREAQALLWHQVPDGSLGVLFEKALDVLIERTKRERFAAVAKARSRQEAPASPGTSTWPRASARPSAPPPSRAVPSPSAPPPSRHIPAAIKRAVVERDGGCCTFIGERGRRCGETRALEFDHLDGFARVREHSADRIRLLCRAHNQHAALQLYGPEAVARGRAAHERRRNEAAARPGRAGFEHSGGAAARAEARGAPDAGRVIHRQLVPGQVHEPAG